MRIREAALKDGLPRKAYAYAPSPDPAEWKLPFLKADGSIDEERLPGAVAALSPGGFRGEKADIPAEFIPMVKSRLRTAYRKWKGSAVEYPATIAESDFPAYVGTCYKCEHPVACDCCDCECENGHVSESLADVTQALDVLEDLYGLLDGEFADGDIEGADVIQQAIDAMMKFVAIEGREMRKQTVAGEMTEAAFVAAISEVGKRNAASDLKMIQTIHDHTHTLGAVHDPNTSYAGMQATVQEAVDVDTDTKPERVQFTEASADGAAFVLLSEAQATFDDATRTVTITPIRPGFGNKRDGFYYPAQTLKEATDKGLFDNLKMFRNHPRRSDEKDLPERDVRDWFATSRKAVWDETRQVPRLDVTVHEESDYRRWKDVPEQIAFSVLGGGMARPGRVNGQDARIVESFSNLRSVDWVTEAGAGGAIVFAESAAEEFDMDIKALTTEQLREELRIREADAAVAEPETEAPVEAAAETPEVEAQAETIETPEPTAEVVEDVAPAMPADAPEAEKAPEGYVTREEFDALKKMLDDAKVKESNAKVVRSVIAESTLPKAAKDVVIAKFAESSVADEAALREAVKAELTAAARLLSATGRPSAVVGMGASSTEDVRESIANRISERWGVEQMPKVEATVIQPGEVVPGNPTTGGTTAPVQESSADIEDRMAVKFGL